MLKEAYELPYGKYTVVEQNYNEASGEDVEVTYTLIRVTEHRLMLNSVIR